MNPSNAVDFLASARKVAWIAGSQAGSTETSSSVKATTSPGQLQGPYCALEQGPNGAPRCSGSVHHEENDLSTRAEPSIDQDDSQRLLPRMDLSRRTGMASRHRTTRVPVRTGGDNYAQQRNGSASSWRFRSYRPSPHSELESSVNASNRNFSVREKPADLSSRADSPASP